VKRAFGVLHHDALSRPRTPSSGKESKRAHVSTTGHCCRRNVNGIIARHQKRLRSRYTTSQLHNLHAYEYASTLCVYRQVKIIGRRRSVFPSLANRYRPAYARPSSLGPLTDELEYKRKSRATRRRRTFSARRRRNSIEHFSLRQMGEFVGGRAINGFRVLQMTEVLLFRTFALPTRHVYGSHSPLPHTRCVGER